MNCKPPSNQFQFEWTNKESSHMSLPCDKRLLIPEWVTLLHTPKKYVSYYHNTSLWEKRILLIRWSSTSLVDELPRFLACDQDSWIRGPKNTPEGLEKQCYNHKTCPHEPGKHFSHISQAVQIPVHPVTYNSERTHSGCVDFNFHK
jgi:hypothetical protein